MEKEMKILNFYLLIGILLSGFNCMAPAVGDDATPEQFSALENSYKNDRREQRRKGKAGLRFLRARAFAGVNPMTKDERKSVRKHIKTLMTPRERNLLRNRNLQRRSNFNRSRQ
jgi:hypothetical protein